MPWALLLNPRFIGIVILILAIAGTSAYIWTLQVERDRYKVQAQVALQVNEENRLELDKLSHSIKETEKLLQEREARLIQQQADNTKRIEEIRKHDASKDCPVADVLNHLLNSLPNGSEGKDGNSNPAR